MGNFLLKLAVAFNNIKYIGAEDKASGLTGIGNTIVKKVQNIMGIVMPIVFGVVLVIGVAYSVVLGVNYAKAEDTEKRDEAKKRLVGAVVGFGIAILAAVLIWTLSQVIDWSSLFKADTATV